MAAESSWESLPPALLGRALRVGAPSDQSARFATCTSFAKAMLLPDPDRKDPELTVHVDELRPALASVLRWAGEGRFLLKLACSGEQHDETQQHASLAPLLLLLQQEGVLLTGVREVWCEGLQLNTNGLSAFVPNLQDLQLEDCQVEEGMLPLSGCNQLQEISLDPANFQLPSIDEDTPPDAWHLQLASLPSLVSLAINTRHHPTSFLPLLAGQLTDLSLYGGYGREIPWRAALQHTAQLTSLRSLQLDCCAAQDLTKLTGLPQLQQMTAYVQSGADTTITTFLQFPYLTNLTWLCLSSRSLQQSFTDQPCSWKELELYESTPQVLARLPLHSLSTLRLGGLRLLLDQTADDVSAAVANINRGQQTQVANLVHAFQISLCGERDEGVGQQEARSYAALLPLIKPLVPQDITTVTVNCYGDSWSVDAAIVAALQQAMPPTITSIVVVECWSVGPSFWPQLATSFPHLKQLCIKCSHNCSPLEVMSYYHSASLAHHLPGVPKVADVEVDWAYGDAGTGEKQQWVDSFSEFNDQLRLLGLKATATVEYRNGD